MQRRRFKMMPMVTVALLALTALMIMRNEQFIFRDEGRLEIAPDPNDRTTVVFTWRSDVDVPMARRFSEGFEEWAGKADRFIIDLNSPGGSIREGEAVIREIEKMKRTHIIDTRVRNRRACYSMCVPIFLQGDQREAAANARFMFHEPTAYDYFTGEKIKEPDFEREANSRRFFNRYFVNSPMDPVWRDQLADEWIGRDVFRTAEELVDERSNIVTHIK